MREGRALLCIGVILATAVPARAAPNSRSYGDVVVAVEGEPRGQHSHGYSEYIFSITNTSADRAHVVTLQLPDKSFGYNSEFIRSLTRSVEVGPQKTARVSLLQPYYPQMAGADLRVSVDGKPQEQVMAVALANSRLSGFVPYPGSYGGAPTGPGPLVLLSKGVPMEFRVKGADVPTVIRMPGNPAADHVGPVERNQFEHDQAAVTEWSPTWLGYSRYDGIVLTAGELAGAPEGVRTALWQYAEAGGCLLVIGPDVAVPPAWKSRRHDSTGLTCYEVGLGRCVTAANEDFGGWPAERWALLAEVWRDHADAWHQMVSAAEANRRLRVADDVQIPVRGLFVLMLSFTILIGPLNLWFLARKNRRIWMLWTVPAISLLTCVMVLGYMLAAEGWRGQLRIESLTVLDETTRRATSVAWLGYYAPLTPSDGLHFSSDSELLWQKSQDYRYGYSRSGTTPCMIDWTHDQHLTSGWVSARLPSHFKLRKSETGRRERMSVERGADGTLSAVNGLGADITEVWVADEKGALYHAERVVAGARTKLTPQGKSVNAAARQCLRDLVRTDTWLVAPASTPPRMAYRGSPYPAVKMAITPMPPPATMGSGPPPSPKKAPPPSKVEAIPRLTPAAAGFTDLMQFLGPNTYLAELEGTPFVEEGLANPGERQCKSRVLGILRGPE